MSTYVMSDIHGQYFSYKKMLKEINFSDDDFLYVLGDCIDRGPDGISIIQDIMGRENAELILGNHEIMLLNTMTFFREREQDKPIFSGVTDEGLNPFEIWTHPCNGGEGTCLDLLGMKEEKRNDIEEFLRKCRLIKRIDIGENKYHLSHSFSLKKAFGKELFYEKTDKKTVESIVWESIFDPTQELAEAKNVFYYKRDIYVVGHIFTQRLGNMDEKGKGKIFKSDSYRGHRVINVDCGMALNSRSSRLGCVRLEDGAEYYVPLLPD